MNTKDQRKCGKVMIQKVVIHWENNLNCNIFAGMKNDEVHVLAYLQMYAYM